MRDDYETGPGSDHGDDSIPIRVIRSIMAEEASRIFGPIALEIKRDADRMERAVIMSTANVESMRGLAERVADYAHEMHEDRRHLEAAHRNLSDRLDRIERHLWPNGAPG